MHDDPTRSVAADLARRGLALPARVLIDAHRPLAPLLADIGAALGPLATIVGGPRAASLARALDDPTTVDRLVGALEDAEQEADGEPG